MTWVRLAGLVLVGFNALFIGVGLGGWLYLRFGSRNTFDVWLVTNTDGHCYVLTDPDEIAAALAVDGMLAVQRLTVLA